jgi:hypothetical protein
MMATAFSVLRETGLAASRSVPVMCTHEHGGDFARRCMAGLLDQRPGRGACRFPGGTSGPTKGGDSAMKRLFGLAVLGGTLLVGAAGFAPASAQRFDDDREGFRRGGRGLFEDREARRIWPDMERFGREQFERGYRLGREAERRSFDRRRSWDDEDRFRRGYVYGPPYGRARGYGERERDD